jgi:hypothetical protein
MTGGRVPFTLLGIIATFYSGHEIEAARLASDGTSAALSNVIAWLERRGVISGED